MFNSDFVTIVSGLPRSGTSAMIQMLAAGGISILTDGQRKPDIDNPLGYFELEAVKALARDPKFLDKAVGKGVKIVHAMLIHLPLDRKYRVIFMRRELDEVLASQRKMLNRHDQKGAALTDAQLKNIYANQLQQVGRWLADRPDYFNVLDVNYAALTSTPRATAEAVNTFLGNVLNVDAMAKVVEPSLYRNRLNNPNPS